MRVVPLPIISAAIHENTSIGRGSLSLRGSIATAQHRLRAAFEDGRSHGSPRTSLRLRPFVGRGSGADHETPVMAASEAIPDSIPPPQPGAAEESVRVDGRAGLLRALQPPTTDRDRA